MTPNKYAYFLCGQIGMMMLARFLFQWIIKFASGKTDGADIVSAALFSTAAVGGVLLFFRILDGISDPIAGAMSDGWVRRGKQRRLLVLFTFAIPSIGLTLSFLPNEGMGITTRWTLLISGLFMFFLGYTFYAIPYWSLIDDYSQHNEDRRRVLSNLLGAGLLLATGVGFVVSPYLVNNFGYAYSSMMFGGVALVLMILPYFAAPKTDEAIGVETASIESQQNIYRSFFRILKHRRFLAIMIIFCGSQMALTIMTAAAPFIAEVLLDGTEADVALLLGPFLGTALPVFVVTPMISRRFGWEPVMFVSSVALSIVFFLTSLLGMELFGSKLMTAAILFACGGPMIALLLGVEAEGITATANERERGVISLYFGVFNLVVKALNGVAIFLAGVFAGFVRTEYGPDAVRGMTMTAGGCLLVGVIGSYLIRPKRSAG